MKHNLLIPIILFFTTIICLGTQCRKDEIVFKYNFIERVDLFPAQKSYKIGDTIWIQYVNPNRKLFDQKSSQYISADTLGIGIQIAFNSLYNAPVNPSGGFCDFISGNIINSSLYHGAYGTSGRFGFGCNINNNLDFKIGIIPKEKGVYRLDLGGGSNNVNGCPNKIVNFPFSTIEYRYKNQDCNKDIYLEIPPNSRGESPKGYTENLIDQKETYIIKVD